MSTQDKPAITQADIDNAVAAANSAAATAQATAVTAAVTDERTRIAAILGSDEAEGRGDLANHLALESDMTADAAVAILAKSEKKAAVATAPGGFNAAMGNTPNPEVGAGSGDDDDAASANSADATITLARSLGVKGVRPAATH